MIYFNTVKLDSQSRLYIDSKIREALKLDKNDTVDIACVGKSVVIMPHEESCDTADIAEISNVLRKLNNCVTK